MQNDYKQTNKPVRTVLPICDRAPKDENDGDVDGDDASTD
jgi:hypothetical protein